MLEIADENAPRKDSNPADALTSPPKQPLSPPRNRDLHLTLVILPPLQHYSSTVRHGVKSRDWGDDHAGSSFMVDKIAWVDEGVAKGEERSGEERRKRIGASMGDKRIGPAVKVRAGLSERSGNAQIAAVG